MAERRAGLGRGLGELFQRTDLDAPPHPVDQHVIVDKTGGRPESGSVTRTNATRRTEDVSRGTSATGERPVVPAVVVDPADGPEEEDRAEPEQATVDPANGHYAEVPIDQIHPNARQPRNVFEEEALGELIGSIREVGLLQPIVVRQDGPESYELVMGERRWRASRAAGLEMVPAIIRSTADDDMLRDALLENIHRVQLNPLEEAAAYQQLMEDFGCTQQQLADRIKRSRSQIANTLRLLHLPPTVQRRVAAGTLTAGHARALLGLRKVADQERLAERIVTEGLSVRATEEIVALGAADRPKPAPRRPRSKDPRLQEISSRLGDFFDARVEVTKGPRKGKIVVEFASEDDLQRIVGLLRR